MHERRRGKQPNPNISQMSENNKCTFPLIFGSLLSIVKHTSPPIDFPISMLHLSAKIATIVLVRVLSKKRSEIERRRTAFRYTNEIPTMTSSSSFCIEV